MNTKEWIIEYQRRIKVMKAFDEGELIQIIFGAWIDCVDPSWNWEMEDYRIKPKPREFWIDLQEDKPQTILSVEYVRPTSLTLQVGVERIKVIEAL